MISWYDLKSWLFALSCQTWIFAFSTVYLDLWKNNLNSIHCFLCDHIQLCSVFKYNSFLPAFQWWIVIQHRLTPHRTRPHSPDSTTITSVLGIKNTFETTSHKYISEEMLLFSHTTFLVWLARLSLSREGLNPLTRPENTLTGLIWSSLGLSQVLTDWLLEMDVIWCRAVPLGI